MILIFNKIFHCICVASVYFYLVMHYGKRIKRPLSFLIFGVISIFWSFLSHGVIILNVVWLIWVDGMRCRKDSLLNTFLVTNAGVFVIGVINKLLGENANYWFICEKPGGDNPFLIGEWPYYLFTFEIAAFFIMLIIYLPMWYVVNRSQKIDSPTTKST